MNAKYLLERGLKARGAGAPMHSHDEAQLTFAASGMVNVHTAAGRWLVPPQLGVWIPAGLMHRVEVLTDAELWMVHWDPAAAQAWAPQMVLDQPFALRVTALLRSLLDAAFASDMPAEKAELVVRLMLHELSATEHAPTFLPMPSSATGQRVATIALRDYGNQLSMSEVASRSATSMRTLSRLFMAETGLTFKLWRQRARIVQAMDRLARGKSIGQVASELGFSSTASFSHAFKTVTDTTPTEFVRPRAG